jgi:hypothetical protein
MKPNLFYRNQPPSYKMEYTDLLHTTINRAIVRRALRNFVKAWRAAYYDTKEPWHNRCTDCEKPLTSPIHRWRQCSQCTWRRECERDGYCWRCKEEGLTSILVKHICRCCECPFERYKSCECPPEEDDYQQEEYISCRMCGGNCEGGDYESWRLCSRRCLVDS